MSTATAPRDAFSPSKDDKNLVSYSRFGRFTTYFILVMAAILIFIPVFWLIISSFKTNVEYNAYPIKILPKNIFFYYFYILLEKQTK